jgi:hypothetical protein
MGTKSVESEVSDCRGSRICDAEGCSYGGGGVSSVSQSDGVVADAGVVLADAGEGRVHGLRVVGHGGVAIQGANGTLMGSANSGCVHSHWGGGVSSYWGGSVAHSGGTQEPGFGNSHQGCQDDKLQTIQYLDQTRVLHETR